jgi:Ring finger domain
MINTSCVPTIPVRSCSIILLLTASLPRNSGESARRTQAERDAEAEDRRRTVARIAARTAAVAQQQQGPNRPTNDQLIDGMSRSDREAFVRNFLKTDVMTMDRAKKMITGEIRGADIEGGTGETTAAAARAGGSMISISSRPTTAPVAADGAGSMISVTRPESSSMISSPGSVLSAFRSASGFFSHASGGGGGDDSTRYPQCAICLERLGVNEEIGLSQNDECPHVYHKACISEWLLSHKECPICRRRFLDLDAV